MGNLGSPTVRAVTSLLALALVLTPGVGDARTAKTQTEVSQAACGAGARTLAEPGEVLFPEVGNGGYRSVHTDLHLVYDAHRNRFLSGTHAVLRLESTQCLTELSLDFQRNDPDRRPGGPRLRVDSITVDGRPAAYRFAQPTYPGNPSGPDDPDPQAHQQGQQDPVGGPEHNPLPPACSPGLSGKDGRHARDGEPCPATKLVITPDRSIPAGGSFLVDVRYHGRPGLHADADGARDGWWATRGGAVTNTEPLGSQAWMPLNNHPSAKPTYDVWVRTQRGKTVIANGARRGARQHRPGPRFSKGSQTVHWRSTDPVASYLVLVLVGDYTQRSFTRHGVRYRLLQDAHIPRGQRRVNARRLAQLDDSTTFLRRFSGPFPFTTDGAAVTLPGHDDMEMQTMIVFSEGALDTSTLFHENMHQWWGDAVTQASFDMVWFKEGLATFAETLRRARIVAHDGHRSAAFRRSLRQQFNRTYRSDGRFWTVAPSDPTPWHYFSGSSTYRRPAAMYDALYLTLGHRRFTRVLKGLQRQHAGSTLTRRQWERPFLAQMPTAHCRAVLSRFFHQWIDTAYAPGGGRHRPRLTAPDVAGGGFPAQCR